MLDVPRVVPRVTTAPATSVRTEKDVLEDILTELRTLNQRLRTVPPQPPANVPAPHSEPRRTIEPNPQLTDQWQTAYKRGILHVVPPQKDQPTLPTGCILGYVLSDNGNAVPTLMCDGFIGDKPKFEAYCQIAREWSNRTGLWKTAYDKLHGGSI